MSSTKAPIGRPVAIAIMARGVARHQSRMIVGSVVAFLTPPVLGIALPCVSRSPLTRGCLVSGLHGNTGQFFAAKASAASSIFVGLNGDTIVPDRVYAGCT